jgi:hypothetical protein
VPAVHWGFSLPAKRIEHDVRRFSGRLVAMKQKQESLACSREQGAHAWELRAAMDLARLSLEDDRPAEAFALLQRYVPRFPRVSIRSICAPRISCCEMRKGRGGSWLVNVSEDRLVGPYEFIAISLDLNIQFCDKCG